MIFPLCGNERTRESLLKLINTRRLPHAMIIEGEEGTGKRTLADFIAKAALCEDDRPPCLNCRNCHLAAVGTHPDIMHIAPEDKKKSIVVKQVDALRDAVYQTPHTASGKVFIIEQADTLNPASANKLLKVLEEPPINVYFILLTRSAKSLLDTVVSRCTVFSLYPPSYDTALSLLTEKSIEKTTAEELLTLYKNNIGKCLAFDGKVKPSLGKEAALEYFDSLCDGNKIGALLTANRLDKNRVEADAFVKELKEILINKIKESERLRATRLEYTKMYNYLCEIEPLLITNVNLALFFTSLTSKLFMIKEK